MLNHTTLLIAAGILLMAAFLQGFSGFGINLFAVPLLAGIWDMHTVVPLCILIGTLCAALLLFLNRHMIDYKAMLPLIVATGLGSPVGVIVLSSMNGVWALRVLAVVIIASAAAQAVAKDALFGRPTPVKGASMGFAGGVLGGAFGTAGPPIALYMHLTHEPKVARSALYLIFTTTGCISLTGHIIAGHTSPQLFATGLVLLPAVFAGSWVGDATAARCNAGLFRYIILVLLAILGAMLLFRH